MTFWLPLYILCTFSVEKYPSNPAFFAALFPRGQGFLAPDGVYEVLQRHTGTLYVHNGGDWLITMRLCVAGIEDRGLLLRFPLLLHSLWGTADSIAVCNLSPDDLTFYFFYSNFSCRTVLSTPRYFPIQIFLIFLRQFAEKWCVRFYQEGSVWRIVSSVSQTFDQTKKGRFLLDSFISLCIFVQSARWGTPLLELVLWRGLVRESFSPASLIWPCHDWWFSLFSLLSLS